MNPFLKFSSLALLALALFAGTACTEPEVDPPPGDDDDATGDDDDATGDDDDSAGDDDDSAGPDPEGQQPPSPEDFQALALEARQDLLQTFTVDAAELSYLEGEQGTELSFPWANDLSYPNGDPVVGDVTVELLEIFDKGTMLIADMPSTGRLPSGEIAQLVSAGEHFVNATQEDQQLVLNNGFVLTAPVDETIEDFDRMNLFRAVDAQDAELDADLDGQAVWIEQEPNPEVFGLVQDADGGGGDPDDSTGGDMPQYWMLSNVFGWTNFDRWYSDPRPKTEVEVDVPDGWDDSNCAVYLSYDGEPTALARFDTYDAGTELFSEHYGLIPIGVEVHVIFVTESEGQWSYAVQAQTIVDNHLTVFASAEDLVETDADGLAAVINALP